MNHSEMEITKKPRLFIVSFTLPMLSQSHKRKKVEIVAIFFVGFSQNVYIKYMADNAVEPVVTTEAIVHAIVSSHPQTRYQVI